jgi:hypothetical protein
MRNVIIALLALFTCCITGFFLPVLESSPIVRESAYPQNIKHYLTPADRVMLFFGETKYPAIEVFVGFVDQDPGGSVFLRALRSDGDGIYYLEGDIIENTLKGGP